MRVVACVSEMETSSMPSPEAATALVREEMTAAAVPREALVEAIAIVEVCS